MIFEVTEDQRNKIAVWRSEQDEIVRLKQLKSNDSFIKDMAEAGNAYYGAVGGAVSYIFTPNSIGVSVVVKHEMTKAELDVTDYDSW